VTDGVDLANFPKPGKHPLSPTAGSGVRARRERAREWMMALINERSQFVRASTLPRLQWIPAIPNPYFLISQTRRIRAVRVHCTHIIIIIIYGRLHMPWLALRGGVGAPPKNRVTFSGRGLTAGQNIASIGLGPFSFMRAFGGEKELRKSSE